MYEHIKAIPAIDFHSHFGPFCCSAEDDGREELCTESLEAMTRSMACANIALSINSHTYTMLPRGRGDVLTGNRMLLEVLNRDPEVKGVYGWAVVDPTKPETYAQAAEMLQHPKVFGIKVHPEEHQYHIRDHVTAIYDFAARHHAVIITHSGEANSLPEDFAACANHYPEVQTIVSHLGCGYDGRYDHQVCALEMNTANNVYTDFSSARSMSARLVEWAVERLGSERFLFGTDSSFYFPAAHRARIDNADISDRDKENILYRNALRIFPFLEAPYRHSTGL